MNLQWHQGFYVLTFAATLVVSAKLFIRAQRKAREHVVDRGLLPKLSELKDDVLLEIYRQKYLNFRHFDTLRWGVHTVVITAAGLVVTFATRTDGGRNTITVLLLLFGVFAGLGWWLLYRLGYNHMKNSFVLEGVARQIGDLTIPSVPEHPRSLLLSAAFMFMAFVGTLGSVAIVTAVFRWLGMI
jgi:hypothetical protein